MSYSSFNSLRRLNTSCQRCPPSWRHRRAPNAGEQQGADFRGVAGLLQAHVAVYLDALAQGAQGVLVGSAGSDDIFVNQAEMIGLRLDCGRRLPMVSSRSPRLFNWRSRPSIDRA